MSGSKRKLSFLAFTTQDNEDQVLLDDEMDRVVWSEGLPGALPGPSHPVPRGVGEEPCRDAAAPRPSQFEPSVTGSPTDLSPLAPEAEQDLYADPSSKCYSSWGTISAGSTRAAPDPRPEDRKVQFDQHRAGDHDEDSSGNDSDGSYSHGRYKNRHLHYKSRKYSLQEGARAGGMSGSGERRVSIAPGEEPLPEVDQDDLASHRTDDPAGLRRHLIEKPSTVHVARKDGGDKLQNILTDDMYKKVYDHSPHAVFVQLDELLLTADGESEWQERARWIKYEEDREEGSDRWGKPHVASLSFHSLLNLRRCLETGVVLLDLDEKDLPGVAYRVVESMVSSQLIEEDDKPVVMRSLLLRHRHVHEDKGFRFSISKKHSSYTSLQSLWIEDPGAFKPRCSVCSATACRRHSTHLIVRNSPVRV